MCVRSPPGKGSGVISALPTDNQSSSGDNGGSSGVVFDIKRYAIHDGPGIRSTVFLKGCPLRCAWCQNPEGRAAEPELSVLANRCAHCGACTEVCPVDDGPVSFDPADTTRARCLRCGACADACPTGARSLVGRELTVTELTRALDRDRVFYDESGGGVTFSGGEPLAQARFLRACLKRCRDLEIHCAVDTCGCAPLEALLEIADYTDLFLYDLKLVDPIQHDRYVGGDATLVVNNLTALCRLGKPIWIRVPLIPGINDDDANVGAIAALVQSLPEPPPVHLLPYHRIGSDKYGRIGSEYRLPETRPPSVNRVAAVADQLRSSGLTVKIGG